MVRLMQKLLNRFYKAQKGQSSFEILFVTIIVILLAGTLYIVSFSGTRDISNIGIIKSDIETYFVQNNILLTIKDIEVVVGKKDGKEELTAKIKLSSPYQFSENQISELETKVTKSIGKKVKLLFD